MNSMRVVSTDMQPHLTPGADLIPDGPYLITVSLDPCAAGRLAEGVISCSMPQDRPVPGSAHTAALPPPGLEQHM